MQTIKPDFTENELLLGYLETDTGTLLLADGLWGSSLPQTGHQILVLDTETERTKFPVYSVMRGGQRFLLIALDRDTINTAITTDDDRVTVDSPFTTEEMEQRNATEEKE